MSCSAGGWRGMGHRVNTKSLTLYPLLYVLFATDHGQLTKSPPSSAVCFLSSACCSLILFSSFSLFPPCPPLSHAPCSLPHAPRFMSFQIRNSQFEMRNSFPMPPPNSGTNFASDSWRGPWSVVLLNHCISQHLAGKTAALTRRSYDTVRCW